MPPKPPTKIPKDTPIVEIDSSDDEGGATTSAAGPAVAATTPKIIRKPSTKVSEVVISPQTALPDTSNHPTGSQSFWRAGAYEIGPSKPLHEQGDLEHARVHPKFLHSNATSHKWASGAIAELLDNAVDEIGNGATYVKVDRVYNKKDNSPVLLFQDDGGGMDPEGMRKCMSLGYSTKTSNNTIGQYGNGFKTSTMRLGADVIVFSRSSRSGRATQSIGLLSYTFLRRTGQDDVIVPMIDFDMSDHWPEPIFCTSPTDWSANLQTILEWSPFESKDDLMLQFEDIESHGTKIFIYNLWLNDEGIYELNFDDDEEDIKLRDEVNQGGSSKANKRTAELHSHISNRIRYSLRAYASILYLRKFTNFKIILRGKPVEQLDIVEDLKHTTVLTYKPQNAASGEVVETKIGFIKEAPALAISGFNVYHKNRLIRPFWKVTADGSSKGNGVIGVLEANFIEPAHDKQDFERSNLFYRLESRLKQMVSEYWKGYSHLVGFKPVFGSPHYVKRDSKVPPQVGGINARKRPQYEPVHLGGPVQDLTTTPLQGLGVAQISTSKGMSCNNELPSDQTFAGPSRESVPEDTSVDTVRSMSIEQICEENIELFRRCEEYMEKEQNLVLTIEGIEKELADTKKKCAQLSSHLESQKKQQSMQKQS